MVAVSVTGILKVWIITAEVSRMQVHRRTDVDLKKNQFFVRPLGNVLETQVKVNTGLYSIALTIAFDNCDILIFRFM